MTPRSSRRVPGRRRLAVAGTLGALAIVLSGCTWQDALGLGWPKGITPEAHDNYKLWIGVVIASLVVGVIVWGLIFWTAIFHRKKANDTELPRQFGYNMPLELVLTVVPFLIIAVLFYFTVMVQERMLHPQGDPEVVVDVTAFQWNWKFGYASVHLDNGSAPWDSYEGADPELQARMESKPEAGEESQGEALTGAVRGLDRPDRTYLHFNEIETLGTTEEIPVLVVPADTRIAFRLNSADVVHAFWVPEFLFKRDVMPNPEANHSVNVFQVTEIEPGAFVGRCAEMCGTYHSMMNFELRVVEKSKFVDYLNHRKEGMNNAQALTAIGEKDPYAVTTKPFEARRGEQVPLPSN